MIKDTQGERDWKHGIFLYMISVLLCVPLLLDTYDTIAWLKFVNTPSALRNGNV